MSGKVFGGADTRALCICASEGYWKLAQRFITK